MEVINHLFGTCGESHPNIFTLILISTFCLVFIKKFKSQVKF
jgi:hypothetical protein